MDRCIDPGRNGAVPTGHASLNLYDPDNPNQPPYTPDFLTEYRAAQAARNRRITDWVWEQLEHIEPSEERAFVVHGTMADPRWLDPAVDPNERKAQLVLHG